MFGSAPPESIRNPENGIALSPEQTCAPSARSLVTMRNHVSAYLRSTKKLSASELTHSQGLTSGARNQAFRIQESY